MIEAFATPDAGVLEMRGGGAVHDRDEHFWIEAAPAGGFRVRTRILPLDARYEIDTDMLYSGDWRPLSLRGRLRGDAGERQVEIERHADHVMLRLSGADSAATTQRLCVSPETLIDLEPSALPMWAMTRRYDGARGGTQTFHWIGRSLVRDVTLESLLVPLIRVGRDETGERYEFSETYSSPAGSYTVDFSLSTDALGRLQRFTVGAGARQVVGVRRPVPGSL